MQSLLVLTFIILVSELGGLDWGQADLNRSATASNNQFKNLPSFTSSSNYPIDNISNTLDEDSLKERVDEIIKVIFKQLIF